MGTLSTIIQYRTHTMIPNEPLLADGTLHCRMFLAGKVAIIRQLVTPVSPAGTDKLSVDASTSDLSTSNHPHSSNVSLPYAWLTGLATEPRTIINLCIKQLYQAGPVDFVMAP